MQTSKKIFLTSSITLGVVLMFWIIYALSFQKSNPAPTQQQAQSSLSGGQAPNAASQTAKNSGIVAISDGAVLSPTIGSDGSSIEYYSKTGQVYQIDFDGSNKKTVSDKSLAGLTDVLWSPDKTQVIEKYSTSNRPSRFYFYDYASSTGQSLGSDTLDVAWAGNNKIYYEYLDPKTQAATLNIANPDGTNWTKITDAPFKSLSIAPIPKTGLISFWNSPDAFTSTEMVSTPVISDEKTDLEKGYFGADYLWSPDGNNLLISNLDQKGGSNLQLGITDSTGGNYKNLKTATFVSKCAWSRDEKTIYCAVPSSFPSGAVLPNDYDSDKFSTADSFWKIDISTGEKTPLIDPAKINTSFDATNLFLNSDESMLFFVNRKDGKLYRIDL